MTSHSKESRGVRRPERLIASLFLIFSMGLSACASEAPATSIVMPEMLATMTEEADPGICENLSGTRRVEMDLDIVGDEARMQGCVDPMMSAESLTLIYFADCLDNTDIAMCTYATTVGISGYFAGTDSGITSSTPIAGAEIRVGDSTIACDISGFERNAEGSSGTITFDCKPSVPGPGL